MSFNPALTKVTHDTQAPMYKWITCLELNASSYEGHKKNRNCFSNKILRYPNNFIVHLFCVFQKLQKSTLHVSFRLSVRKSLRNQYEKKPKGKGARKEWQPSEKTLMKYHYKYQNHKMHRERFKDKRTILNKDYSYQKKHQ